MNTRNTPSIADLPSSKQLRNSTLIAIAAATAILVTVVLPAEYAIDPTGIGRALQLTDMGEIKTQLAAEAEADRQPGSKTPVDSTTQVVGNSLENAADSAVTSASAAESASVKAEPVPSWKDVTTFVLKPGQGIEYKLIMEKGATANFDWSVQGGSLNYDTHGDALGRSISYEKGRDVPSQKGLLVAAFKGNHGWFWRNRGQSDVTVTLKTAGDYSKLFRN